MRDPAGSDRGTASAVLPNEGRAARTREDRFRAEVRRHLLRNYLAHLAHGLLGQTGFRLVQAPTFVPAYVHLLSGSDLVVGIARGCQSLGQLLSPFLGATLIESRRRVLPAGLLVGAAMRIQILGLALTGLWLQGSAALLAVCLFLGLFGFFLGMQGVIFNFLVSKVIPVERRGVLLGLRNALAGVTAAAVGLAGGAFVERNALGNGYGATFLVAFVLTSLGLVMLLFVREPVTPRVRPRTAVGQRLRELPALLRADRAFTHYFLARALAMMGRMAVPFYVLAADVRFHLSGHDLGLLTAAFLLAQTTMNLLWGTLADRCGFRVVFLTALALWMLSTLALMTAGSRVLVVGVFVGLGAGLGGFMMSAQNLVLEFGSRENLPIRIAVANTSSELVGAVGPVLGGLLATWASYAVVFWAALAFQGAAFAIVTRHVPEPRWRRSEERVP